LFSIINAKQEVNMQMTRKEINEKNKLKYECKGGGFKPPQA
jgi:hypothetical protein